MHHRKYGAKDPTRRAIGWGVVIAIHALILWALVTGTARDALKIIKKPLEAAVIQEVIIPPPPPPPPKVIEPPKPQAPKVEAPPPPFVPPPEVRPPTTTAPTIESVQAPPPTPAVIAPPPPAPAPAPVGRADIKLACPTQVRPEMPSRAAKEGIEGVVRAQVLIRDGAVVKVDILSGPQMFREPVREAMLRYRCVTTGEVIATQEFAFKFE